VADSQKGIPSHYRIGVLAVLGTVCWKLMEPHHTACRSLHGEPHD
jgi:hypothetical protein